MIDCKNGDLVFVCDDCRTATLKPDRPMKKVYVALHDAGWWCSLREEKRDRVHVCPSCIRRAALTPTRCCNDNGVVAL